MEKRSDLLSVTTEVRALAKKMVDTQNDSTQKFSESLSIKAKESRRLKDEAASLAAEGRAKDAEIEAQRREIARLKAVIQACEARARERIEELEREAQKARSEAAKAQREVAELEAETSQLRIALARSFNEMKERCDAAATANCMRLDALLTTYRTLTDQAIASVKAIVGKSQECAEKAASIIEENNSKSGESSDKSSEPQRRALFAPEKDMMDDDDEEEEGERREILETPSKGRMIVEEGTPSQDSFCSKRRPFVLGTRLSAKARMPTSGNGMVVSANIFDKENEEDEENI